MVDPETILIKASKTVVVPLGHNGYDKLRSPVLGIILLLVDIDASLNCFKFLVYDLK